MPGPSPGARDTLQAHALATLARLPDDGDDDLGTVGIVDETSTGRIEAVSTDGRFVAARVRARPEWVIHEAATGQLVRPLSHGKSAVAAVHFHPDGRRAVSTASDGTALAWDLSTPPGMPILTPGPIDTPGWRRCWEDLGGKAEVADRRAWGMAMQPREAVRLVAGRLKPVPPRDKARIARLIRGLGDDDLVTREAATNALAALGPLAEPEVREAAASGEAEAKRRAARLLSLLAPHDGPETLAARRAVLVLERIATPEARRLLAALAAGEPLAATTREAAAALHRLTARR